MQDKVNLFSCFRRVSIASTKLKSWMGLLWLHHPSQESWLYHCSTHGPLWKMFTTKLRTLASPINLMSKLITFTTSNWNINCLDYMIVNLTYKVHGIWYSTVDFVTKFQSLKRVSIIIITTSTFCIVRRYFKYTAWSSIK